MADTIVNTTPEPPRQSDSSGWIVAVIILLVIIIVGGYFLLHHRTYVPTPAPATNVQVTIPTGGSGAANTGSTQ